MKRNLKIAFLLFFLSSPATALPRSSFHQYVNSQWQVEDGLPHNSVPALLQTRDGYILVGTNLGLVRFNAERFQTIETGKSRQSRWIFALHEDRKGTLWIGTNGAGVFQVTGERKRNLTSKDGLACNSVTSFAEVAGTLWIGTYEGLNSFQAGTLKTYSRPHGLPDNYVHALSVGPDGTLWVGTKRGLARFHNGKFHIEVGDVLKEKFIYALHHSHEGTLWIGTTEGLFALRNEKIRSIEPLATAYILSLKEDSHGNIWAGTHNYGLKRIHRDSVSSFMKTDGLIADSIRSILEDREGNLWIGSYGGGLQQIREGKFTIYSSKEGLPSDSVTSVMEDRDRNLWIGTQKGLARLNRDSQSFSIYNNQNGLPDEAVHALRQSYDGSIWIGTAGGLAKIMDGRVVDFSFRNNFSGQNILLIYQDRSNNLWIATKEKGLFRVFQNAVSRYDASNHFTDEMVTAVIEKADGDLLFGTYGSGIYRFRNGAFQAITQKTDLQDSEIYDLYLDRSEALWIGTLNGLYRSKRDEFVPYPVSDSIHKFLEDDSGNFWLCTSTGIAFLEKNQVDNFDAGKASTIFLTRFNRSDGLQTTSCAGGIQPAAWKTTQGELWFATAAGAARVHPGEKKINPVPPPIKVESFVVDGVSMTTLPAELQPGSRFLEIHYTALSFIKPDAVTFQYRLQPFDKEWIDAGTRRVAIYTNLSAADYKFLLRARSADGIWSKTPSSTSFAIRPYFYQRPWFGIFTLATAIGIGFLIYRYRVQSLVKQNLELERIIESRTEAQRRAVEQTAILQERNRISRELHDCTSQGLAGVVVQIEAGLQVLENSEEKAKMHLMEACTLARSSLDETRRSMRALAPQDLEKEALPRALEKFVAEQVSHSSMNIQFTTSGNSLILSRSTEIHLFRIAQEGIRNAMKHSGANQVGVHLQYSKSSVAITVTDDGRGFHYGDQSSGMGLFGMKDRARQIGASFIMNSGPDRGTEMKVLLKME